MSEAGMTPEEQEQLARELAEEFRKLRVEDLLIQTLVTISSVGYRRLGLTPDSREERDLDQARLAIETLRALTPVLERVVPAELIRDFNQSIANLQLAYARAASEQAAPPSEAATPRGQTPDVSEGGTSAAESEAAAEAAPPAQAPDAAEEDMSRGQTPGRGQNGEEADAGG